MFLFKNQNLNDIVQAIKDIGNWFLRKSSNNKIIIVLLVLLCISVGIIFSAYEKLDSRRDWDRHYHDSIHVVYQKALDTCQEQSKKVLIGVIQKQQVQAAESEKNKRETERLMFEYQKLYIESQNKKN